MIIKWKIKEIETKNAYIIDWLIIEKKIKNNNNNNNFILATHQSFVPNNQTYATKNPNLIRLFF